MKDHIDATQLTADLAAMIRTASVNPFGGPITDATQGEAAMADLFEAQLRALGLTTDTAEVAPGRRNVWGRLPGNGSGPTVLLAGHLDTVGVAGYDAPFEPTIKQGRIHGRGSCDMKAGLAAYLATARALIASGTPLAGDIIIAGVIDEEHAMAGSYHFGLHGPQVDCAIVAEPSQLAISPAHKGQILLTIRTTGKSAHSSLPDQGVNAIYHMSHLVQALADEAARLQDHPGDPVCGRPSLSVGVIRGGDNACSVPDTCEIDIDRRTIPGEDHAKVLDDLRALADRVAAQHPQMQVTFDTPFLNLPPLATADDAPIMQAIHAATTAITGAAEVIAFPGSTDAPNFRCPTVICGPGNLAQCHSLNEYVAIDEIVQAVHIYLATLRGLQAP